jgi:hypothetical protein
MAIDLGLGQKNWNLTLEFDHASWANLPTLVWM